MVQINVSQQLKEPIGSVRNYHINETADITGDECPVEGDVTLVRTNQSILVKGTLRTEVERTCSRCLSLFKCPLTIRIEEEFFPVADVSTGISLPLPDEPGSFTIDDNNILDLSEAIRQYALMAVPMKPLCKPDCSGLCPGCGVNLNQGSCQCPPRTADRRWAELSKLAASLNGRENRS